MSNAFIPFRPQKSCYPLFEHVWDIRPNGLAVGGWAHGERTELHVCKVCGEKRGPFVCDSADAGF